MNKIMQTISIGMLVGLFLLVGLAVGFQAGRSSGFETGSEWALMQADLLAREAGLTMPVVFEGGNFHVILKQRPDLYRKAWHAADEFDETRMAAHGEQEIGQTAF